MHSTLKNKIIYNFSLLYNLKYLIITRIKNQEQKKRKSSITFFGYSKLSLFYH